VFGSSAAFGGSVAAAAGNPSETWIIVPPASPNAGSDALAPGTGALYVRDDGGDIAPLPLVHTAAAARIDSIVASVTTQQRFRNPFTEPIEAEYAFPLPRDAAITDFVMTVGQRRIRGLVRDREEGRRIYAAARAAGHTASLLEQERPNIFTQSVANIAPGHEVAVDITYFHRLDMRDGAYEFVFPMAIGPRFTPPGTGDVYGGPAPNVPPGMIARPAVRSGRDIDLTVQITGFPLAALRCPTHDVVRRTVPGGGQEITLAAHDRIANRDFVLQLEPPSTESVPSMIAAADASGTGGHVLLTILPPAGPATAPRSAIELVLVIDTSGSMEGLPLTAATAAARRAVERLQPGDRLQLVRFSNSATAFRAAPVDVTPGVTRDALRWIDGLAAGGGTMMAEGLGAALGLSPDPAERQRVIGFMTDGFIGNEADVLRMAGRDLGRATIFSFGIGTSPNRHLLDSLAEFGAGESAYVQQPADAVPVIDGFLDRLTRPALDGVQIEWSGAEVVDVYPARLGPVRHGRPVVVSARYLGSAPPAATIRGWTAGQRVTSAVPSTVVTPDAGDRSPLPVVGPTVPPAIATVWARQAIDHLDDRLIMADEAQRSWISAEVRRVALEHGLVSSMTSFVAVDAAQPMATPETSGGPRRVTIPPSIPAGTRFTPGG
ncbi:MAG: VIT domain-containing protein, partial [Phycisphaerales bacterium]